MYLNPFLLLICRHVVRYLTKILFLYKECTYYVQGLYGNCTITVRIQYTETCLQRNRKGPNFFPLKKGSISHSYLKFESSGLWKLSAKKRFMLPRFRSIQVLVYHKLMFLFFSSQTFCNVLINKNFRAYFCSYVPSIKFPSQKPTLLFVLLRSTKLYSTALIPLDVLWSSSFRESVAFGIIKSQRMRIGIAKLSND